ncbi:MAG TPA: ATP-binding protein, partial [Burkholderiaceae bacterium]
AGLAGLGDEVFRRLVDSVHDYAIFLLTPTGVIATWNAGAERIKGYSAGEAIGRHFSMFYTPEALSTDWPAEELRRSAREGRLEDEGWRVRKDGTRFWANVTISPLRNEDGRLLGFSKVTRDLTQRRRIEALELEGRRISDFIAMLSHELRNPLAPIQNAAAILTQHELPKQAAWCVSVIDRQANHLRRLVDDLLDVSRIASGKIRIDKTVLDFAALVRDAVDAARPVIAVNRHSLDLRIAELKPQVLGDATRLTQVFVNLLNNAARYTPDGGRIEVAVEATPERVSLSVADNGVGMSQSLLQRAFEPFVQGTTRVPGRADAGLGIGLTLVKSIVELHGGIVTARSPGENQGATVTVSLPTVHHGGLVLGPPGLPLVTAARRIMVVDDNADGAESLAMVLRMAGHQVLVITDALEAERAAITFGPDAVLLDLGMPGIDGHELAQRLHAHPTLARTRLIAVTGCAQDSDRAATGAGFVGHVSKPVDYGGLLALLG